MACAVISKLIRRFLQTVQVERRGSERGGGGGGGPVHNSRELKIKTHGSRK